MFNWLFFSNARLAGIPLPVVVVWAVVKANWFTYTSSEGQHVSRVFTSSLSHPILSNFFRTPTHRQVYDRQTASDFNLEIRVY